MALPSYRMILHKCTDDFMPLVGEEKRSRGILYPLAESPSPLSTGEMKAYLRGLERDLGLMLSDNVDYNSMKVHELALRATKLMDTQGSPKVPNFVPHCPFPELTEEVLDCIRNFAQSQGRETANIHHERIIYGIFGRDFEDAEIEWDINKGFGVNLLDVGMNLNCSYETFWNPETPIDVAMIIASEREMEGAPEFPDIPRNMSSYTENHDIFKALMAKETEEFVNRDRHEEGI